MTMHRFKNIVIAALVAAGTLTGAAAAVLPARCCAGGALAASPVPPAQWTALAPFRTRARILLGVLVGLLNP